MFRRGRVSDTQVAGWLIGSACAALIVGVSLVAYYAEPYNRSAYDQQKTPEQDADPAPTPEEGLSAFQIFVPRVYQPRCEKPQNKDDADLCEQQRMAQAAERTVYWAKWQFYVSVFGLGALFGTLWLSRRATKAAIDAAKAGQASVAVAQDTAQRELRAYLFARISKATPPIQEHGITRVTIEAHNFGQTPAYLFRHISAIHIAEPAKAEPFPILDLGKMSRGNVLAPTASVIVLKNELGPFNAVEMDLLGADKRIIYLYGAMTYVDAFGHDRWTYYRYFLNFRKDGALLGIQIDPDGNDAT